MRGPVEYTFAAQIWQVMPVSTGASGRWLLELRDAQAKSVSYVVVDLDAAFESGTGQENDGAGTVGSIFTVEEAGWWSSLAGVGTQCLFLHRYGIPELPEPTELLAADLQTGRLQWVLPGHRFAGISDDGSVQLTRRLAEEVAFYECDELTGNLRPGTRIIRASPGNPLMYPERYMPGDPYFDQVAGFLYKTVKVSGIRSVDYIEYGDYMIFSYGLGENEKMVQYLAVIDRWKEVRHHLEMVGGVGGPGRDHVLLKESSLVFLKEKHIFAGIKLEGS